MHCRKQKVTKDEIGGQNEENHSCRFRKGQNRKDVRPVVKVDMKGRVTGGESGGYPIRLVFGPKIELLNVYPKKP